MTNLIETVDHISQLVQELKDEHAELRAALVNAKTFVLMHGCDDDQTLLDEICTALANSEGRSS